MIDERQTELQKRFPLRNGCVCGHTWREHELGIFTKVAECGICVCKKFTDRQSLEKVE